MSGFIWARYTIAHLKKMKNKVISIMKKKYKKPDEDNHMLVYYIKH